MLSYYGLWQANKASHLSYARRQLFPRGRRCSMAAPVPTPRPDPNHPHFEKKSLNCHALRGPSIIRTSPACVNMGPRRRAISPLVVYTTLAFRDNCFLLQINAIRSGVRSSIPTARSNCHTSLLLLNGSTITNMFIFRHFCNSAPADLTRSGSALRSTAIRVESVYDMSRYLNNFAASRLRPRHTFH